MWKVLVVDDDLDVHAVTKLVLKNKRWRNQGFELSSAYTLAQAVEILEQDDSFHIVLVDVIMEEQDSGLKLCELVREKCQRSTRIILRTGQAGLAPEEDVLNEYDIDHYLHKADVTPDRLFSVVRSCLRSSQDISTLLAYGKQLQSFTRTLQYVSTVDDLIVFMREALRFLELKHHCKTLFFYDLNRGDEAMICDGFVGGPDRSRFSEALILAHRRGKELMADHPGPDVGLESSMFAITFEAREDASERSVEAPSPIPGGIIFALRSDGMTPKSRRDLTADARLFIENWCIAFGTLRLRERLNQEQVLRNQMYRERLESIATMVAGVAHELNTPLGVARTAGSMIVDLVQEVRPRADESAATTEADLHEAVRLMNKNLDRAHRLIQSFRQLSSSQLSDARMTADLRAIVTDCIETMAPDLRKAGVSARIHAGQDDFKWNGYPGHLSQVIINLIQNAIRYAYAPGQGGTVEVELARLDPGGFRVRFIDHGRGVDERIKSRIFDPFVTSGREHGGTGLGLSISHNIVTDLLKGSIGCESEPGRGTTFVIDIPESCPVDDGESEFNP